MTNDERAAWLHGLETNGYMTPYLAVFNCHKNNARQLADRDTALVFGQEKFDETIGALGEGIMAVFESMMPINLFWIARCWGYVNATALDEPAAIDTASTADAPGKDGTT